MSERNDKRRQQIAKLRGQGLSFREVGERLDPPVTGSCVRITAKRMGIPGKIKLAVDKRGRKA